MYSRKTLVLLGILCFTIPYLIQCQSPDTSFSFTLRQSAKTSAGIYTSDSTLVRTLWSGVNYNAGTYKIKWDGTDDTGYILPNGNYIAKVLSNNVSYQWEGVIGNTSDSMTGSTKHRSFEIINCMTIAGNTAYCGAGYNEGHTSEFKFKLSTPQQRSSILPQNSTSQASFFTTTDGINVYWAGNDPVANTGYKNFIFATSVADDTESIFPNGNSLKTEWGRNYKSVIDYVNNANAKISGIAVQKNHNFLFVSHKDLNEIHVLDKSTGAIVQTITTFTSPRSLEVDSNDDLWIVSSTTSLSKYKINSDGTISSLDVNITGLINPLAIAVSPDNSVIIVADGGISQQLKAYNNNSGSLSWTYGQAGGYTTDPIVANDKFYFSDFTNDIQIPFIAFQEDGSFWVSDPGNYRVQHFSANRTYIDRTMYFPCNYSVYVDPNNPARLFAQYLEFAIDYSKPLAPNNGSWTLVKNWRGSIMPQYYSGFIVEIFKSVTTLSNGRTYGLLKNNVTNKIAVIELPPQGPIRFTGIEFNANSNQAIHSDGTLRSASGLETVSGTLTWYKQGLLGFDNSNNPIWDTSKTLAATTSTSDKDPILGGARKLSGEITSSGIIISFSGNAPPNGSSGYHLGGIKIGENRWKWKTALPTTKEYNGAFPSDGYFDIGNDALYTGSVAMAIDRNIFWGYNGEFWKGSQTNKWNHVYDNGLFIGQFGIAGSEVKDQEAPAMMAGNAFSPSLVKVDSNYYLYHNDESYHGGVHRWKISGLNTIQEQSISLTDSFKRTSEDSIQPGVDLMQGLPFASILANNTDGWTRNPETEDYTNYDQYWSVKTNSKTYSKRKSPDLYINYQHTKGPYSVSRDLGTRVNLFKWRLWGLIYFDGYPNANTQSFFQVVDNSDKILFRFYTTITFGDPSILKIYANNVLIGSGNYDDLKTVTSKLQPINITAENRRIKVAYATYDPVTVDLYDSTGNAANPKTMQLLFTYVNGENHSKIVDIDQMRFEATVDFKYYRSKSNGLWSDFTSWQSSADSINWVDAITLPDSSSNSIIIQNGHTISITGNSSVNHLFINNGGILNIVPKASLIIIDGPGNDITIAPSGSMVIKSDSTGTGRLENTSGTIAGNVTVERYISSKNNQSYRLLSPSVNTAGSSKPYIRDNWQEGQNNTNVNSNSNILPLYGIHITGSKTGANGFDATASGDPSLFILNQASPNQEWLQVLNTNATNLEAKTGYWVYIRGNRSVNLKDTTSSSNTILRATGTLLTGTQKFTNLESNGRNSLVTNPYASPVNWNTIYNDASTTNSANFENYFTYWDPNVGSKGGYVSINANGVKSVNSNTSLDIQSGEAFFIRAKSGINSPAFTIKESHKSSVINTEVFRSGISAQLMTSLYFTNADNTHVLADGVNAVFSDSSFIGSEGGNAEEIANNEENIAIVSAGRMLSINERPLIQNSDTLPLIIQRLKVQNYEWEFNPDGFKEIKLQADLDDKFLHTRTPISLSNVTKIPFTVYSDTASSASDRFQVVFASQQALPVTFSSIRAFQKMSGIQVEWTVQQEANVDKYEVEKSLTGYQFAKAGNVQARAYNTRPDNNNWFDANPASGNNFYRIKTIDQSGAIKYSSIVNVKISREQGSFEVYPNPIAGNNLTIQFNNIPKGVYRLKLINTNGQTVYTKAISHLGGGASQTITLTKSLTAGEYNLQIAGNGIFFNKQVLK